VGIPQGLTRIDCYKGIAHKLPAEYDPERGIGAVGGFNLVSIGLAVASAPILLFVYRILFRK